MESSSLPSLSVSLLIADYLASSKNDREWERELERESAARSFGAHRLPRATMARVSQPAILKSAKKRTTKREYEKEPRKTMQCIRSVKMTSTEIAFSLSLLFSGFSICCLFFRSGLTENLTGYNRRETKCRIQSREETANTADPPKQRDGSLLFDFF